MHSERQHIPIIYEIGVAKSKGGVAFKLQCVVTAPFSSCYVCTIVVVVAVVVIVVVVVVIRYEFQLCRVPHRMLYWADWSLTIPAIYRSSVVNPDRQILAAGGIDIPNALTIDFTGDELHDTGILAVSSQTAQLYSPRIFGTSLRSCTS